ncbi:class I SAM-dependent methyltransferase [Streptomyces sp. NRRL F-2747]|uniref:class I SAM-dependent methyltransferase n=1 Tax=Streptomyces sp. NRRL F-2747 TaxID=1463843 RepID=UPI002D21E0E2|nr:class I SAM-dependent methyltransferase [Streptomyces sp. NRRL F-2747]
MTDPEDRAWSSGSYARAIHTPEHTLSLCDGKGWSFPLDVERWCAKADEADLTVLRRCAGKVLDIGCGAGRLVEALTGRGGHALGIDICPSAVITTVCRGGSALSVRLRSAPRRRPVGDGAADRRQHRDRRQSPTAVAPGPGPGPPGRPPHGRDRVR